MIVRVYDICLLYKLCRVVFVRTDTSVCTDQNTLHNVPNKRIVRYMQICMYYTQC